MKVYYTYLIGFAISTVFRKEYYICASSSNAATFAITFQSTSTTKLPMTTDEWALYKHKLPAFKEFTICHWDKLRYFNSEINSVWSYGYVKQNGEFYDFSLDYSLIFPTANRHCTLTAWIGNGVTYAKIVPFSHRKWNHICWSYSSVTGNSSLYHNGNLLESQTSSLNESAAIVAGHKYAVDSAFVVGQEQDKVRGGYYHTQLYIGEISELNMWNYTLDDRTITEIAHCKKIPKGNIIKWSLQEWKINRATITEVSDRKLFCQNDKQLVIFPQRQPLHIAKTLCSTHGGKIATPISASENKEIVDLVSKHPRCTNMNATAYRNMGTFAWLGVKRIEGVWYDVRHDDIINPINYSLWNKNPFMGRTNIDCSYINSDGEWAYQFGNSGVCKMAICTVCVIVNSPAFTLKGECGGSPITYNYYLNTDDKKQITYYDGYKGTNDIIARDNFWISTGFSFNISLSLPPKMNYPVGRTTWSVYDEVCGVDRMQNMTLSICEFGQEFSCNSGNCIDIQKRCDNVKDCEDNSDEHECHFVQIPSTYNKADFPRPREMSINPISLGTHVNIESIHMIDTTEMLMEMTIKIIMQWADGRLRFTNLPNDTDTPVPTELMKRIWIPLDHLVHDNAIIGDIYQDGQRRQLWIKPTIHSIPADLGDPFENNVHDSFKTTLNVQERFRIKFMCTFDMKKFPFDKQNCDFKMHINTSRDTNLQMVSDSGGVTYFGPTIVNEFEVTNISSVFGRDGKHIWLEYQIKMNRLYQSQITSTIFPTALLWILAYFTLCIKVDNFNNRFMGSVTALLVLSALLGSINRSLPKTAYFKYIDLWFLWYITNIFIIIVYHIILDQVSDSTTQNIIQVNSSQSSTIKNDLNHSQTTAVKNSRKRYFNKIGLVTFPLLTGFFIVIYFYQTLDKDQ